MLFISVVLSIPLYGFLIWSLYEPDESIIFLDKWRYDEEPTFSELQMKLFKIGNIAGIVLLTGILIMIAFSGVEMF